MSQRTSIEWTDATWNPIRGCSRVSPGCKNCYAAKIAKRFSGPGQPYEGLVRINAAGECTDDWNGVIRLAEKHLLDPLKWRPVRNEQTEAEEMAGCYSTRPRRIFVNSMSDLFHENVPDEWLDRIFAVMALCPQHTFQVLTKRPERMLAYLSDAEVGDRIWNAMVRTDCESHLSERHPGYTVLLNPPCDASYSPLPNVQLGVSVEDQKNADERIPLLLQTPAAVRFISAEPLLGQVDITFALEDEYPSCDGFVSSDRYEAGYCGKCAGHISDPIHVARIGKKLDWVIVGGESGPGARPMHPDWARGLRDQCVAAGVPFFFKQWGEWLEVERRNDLPGRPWMVSKGDVILRRDGTSTTYDKCGGIDEGVPMRKVGKKAAGALLDGREWKEFPL